MPRSDKLEHCISTASILQWQTQLISSQMKQSKKWNNNNDTAKTNTQTKIQTTISRVYWSIFALLHPHGQIQFCLRAMRGVCEVHLTAVWGLGINKHPLMHRKQDHHTFTPHRGRRTGSLRASGEYTLGTSQRTHWNLIPKPNVSAWDYSGLGCPSLMQIIKSWLLTEGHVDHWDKPRGLPSLQSFCFLLFFWLLGCLQSFCPLFHLMLAEGQGRLESFMAFSQMRNIKLWDTDLNEVTPNEVIPALLFPMQGSLYGSSRSCVYRGTNRWHCPSCTSTHPQRPVCQALFQLLQTEWRTTQTLWHKGSDDATHWLWIFILFLLSTVCA